MIILPAIDLFQRKAVRMEKGKEEKIILQIDNPYELALFWYKEGAKALHLVDLQGAIREEETNMDIIENIIKNISIPIEVGGGIRSIEKIQKILSFGAWRVIISSFLKEDLIFLKNLIDKFKGKIIPSIDWKDGKISIKGWKEEISWKEIKEKLEYLGFEEIIFTDISRDGTLKGINKNLISFVLESTSFNLWIAGGISSLDDLKKIKELNTKYHRIKGVIIGRALLEGKIDFREAERILC
ncbi:MAG: HisA/HisF-related TIM barrel protein [Dictyoglomaceae bacterium]|nr:HisA/HisF-related TIM barrel protein [Dictyoglomaceae bacterium]